MHSSSLLSTPHRYLPKIPSIRMPRLIATYRRSDRYLPKEIQSIPTEEIQSMRMRNSIDTNGGLDRDESESGTAHRTTHATKERVATSCCCSCRRWKRNEARGTRETGRRASERCDGRSESMETTRVARETRIRRQNGSCKRYENEKVNAHVRRCERTRLTFGTTNDRKEHDAAQSKTVPGGTDGKTSGRQAQMGDGISRCANVSGALRTDGDVDEDDNQLTRLRRCAGANRPWGLLGCATGYLVSVDAYMNLQLANCEEWIDDKLAGNLGEVLIRCNNVLYLRQAPEEE